MKTNPRRLTTVLALLAAAGLCAFLAVRKGPELPTTVEPVSTREVPRSILALREGRLYAEGETAPFTGLMVEHYPSGEPRSRTQVAAGWLHGLSEGWFTNGVRQVREEFRDNVADGLRTRWYPDGTKAAETPIVNGKVHGLHRRWHANGRLSAEVEMRDDQPDGWSRAFGEDGSLVAEVRMEKGRVVERRTATAARRPDADAGALAATGSTTP